jgi:hypothetical protein
MHSCKEFTFPLRSVRHLFRASAGKRIVPVAHNPEGRINWHRDLGSNIGRFLTTRWWKELHDSYHVASVEAYQAWKLVEIYAGGAPLVVVNLPPGWTTEQALLWDFDNKLEDLAETYGSLLAAFDARIEQELEAFSNQGSPPT